MNLSSPSAPVPLDGDDPTPRALSWPVLLLAAAAALVGFLVAPASWPAGAAELELARHPDASRRFTYPVVVGTSESVVLPAPEATAPKLVLPQGIPRRGAIEIAIHGLASDDQRLDAWEVRLNHPDGRSSLIPGMRIEEGVVVHARQVPHHAAFILALLGVVIVLWLSEAVPLWITGLLVPCALVISGAAKAQAALAPFFHPIIALFLGGFLLAEAMQRCGLGHRIALWLITRFGRTPQSLFAALLALSAFLSMWMSNTASAALLIPIAIAVTAPLASVGYRKAVVLGIAFAATLGGVGSAIGTPANPLAIEFLERYTDRQIDFVDWFLIGLPLVVLLLPLIALWLWKRMDAQIDLVRFEAAREVARQEAVQLGRPTASEWKVALVFIVIVGVWLTQSLHGLSTGIVALAGAVVLALLGRIQTEDLGRVSWSALLTFGGGLALGTFMTESGVSDWVATRLTFLAGMPDFVAVSVVGAVALGLTAVASNTASAAMLIPLAIPLARLVGVDPALMVLVVAIASSVDFALVIGTPPTMIAYSTRLFSAREIFRHGIVLDLIGIVLLVTLVVGAWHLLGVV